VSRVVLTGIPYFATIGLSGLTNVDAFKFQETNDCIQSKSIILMEVESEFHEKLLLFYYGSDFNLDLTEVEECAPLFDKFSAQIGQ